MSNRRQRWHLERSVVTLNALRARGVTRDLFEAALLGERSERAKRVSARTLWAGGRPLRFDPVGQGASELERLDSTWPGSASYFFHPLWNLFSPPPRSSEKYRLAVSHAPAWVWEDELDQLRRQPSDRDRGLIEARLRALDRRDAALRAASRMRVPMQGRPLDLRVVHACLLQLQAPLRDQFMERATIDVADVPAIHVPWTRACHGIDADLTVASQAPLMDGLAATLALALEAGLTGRERDFLRAGAALRELRKALKRDVLFDGVATRIAAGVRHAVALVGVLETHLVHAQLDALPQSWRQRAEIWAMEIGRGE